MQDCDYNALAVWAYEVSNLIWRHDRPRLYCYALHELKRSLPVLEGLTSIAVVVIGFCLLLKKSVWLLHPIGDKAPPAARDSSEVARTLNWRY